MRDIWPTEAEIDEVVGDSISAEMFVTRYADVFAGDERWQSLPTPDGETFEWDEDSTYVRKAPVLRRHARGARTRRGRVRRAGAAQAG